MAANSKVNRMVGLALAATVAGSLTMAPAASAQTPTTTHAPVVDTPSSNSPTSSAAETTPSTSHAPSSAPATSAVTPSTSVKAPVEGNGTGTADARYASNGWTYTALASNPKNQRVYAISEARDGYPAGHLLRIAPSSGLVADLGEIELPGGDATSITSAAFTSAGTLVLFDGQRVHTLDLSDDAAGEGMPDLDFTTKKLELTDLDSAGTPRAWAAVPGKDNELVAVSVKGKDASVWTLNVDGKAATAKPKKAEVAAGTKLAELGALDYAYNEEGGATVFSDGTGRGLKLESGKLSAEERRLVDNYAGVAGLALGSPYKVVTQTAAPSSSAEATPSSAPATTTTSQSSEPAASANTTAPVTTPAKQSDIVSMRVRVITEEKKTVQGASFKVVGGKVIGFTDADGYADIDIIPDNPGMNRFELSLDEAPAGYLNQRALVGRGTDEVLFELKRDPKVTPTSSLNRPQEILQVINQAKPVVSSALLPVAAIAGAAGAGSKPFGGTKISTTSKTSTSTTTSGVSTGRSTSATSTARVVARSGGSTATARVVSNGSTTRATIVDDDDDERDEDLAETGTPMRGVIALGILAMLLGGVYIALGRRRDNA